MKIKDILALPKTIGSVNTITEYINTNALSLTHYHTIFEYLLEIKLELNLVDEVIDDAIYHYQKYQDNSSEISFLKIFKMIIDAAIIKERYDLAYQYIKLRANSLPVMEKYLVTYDIVNFKKATHQPYKNDLEAVLSDVMPDNDRLFFAKELLNIYLKENDTTKALTLTNQMKRYDPEESFIPVQLQLLYQTNQISEAKNLAIKYQNNHAFRVDCFIILLKIYLDASDYHHAVILETDHEEMFDSLALDKQIEIYNLLIKLYTSTENKLSSELYKDKLKRAVKAYEKQQKEEKPKKVKESLDKVVSVTPIYQKEVRVSNVVNQFEWAFDLLIYSHQISEVKDLREYLRSFFIKVDSHIKAKDFIVYLYQTSTLYNYKKERLYDKVIIKELFNDTLAASVKDTSDEVVLNNDTLTNYKNILTQTRYDLTDIKCAYAFPIGDEGVFIIHLDYPLADLSEYYDIFKLISAMIYNHLIDDKTLIKLRNENILLNKIFNSPLHPIRILDENFSTYNIEAQKLLNVESHLPLELFYIDLEYHFVKEYQETIKELFTKPNLVAQVTYLYQNIQIKERLYSIKDNDQIKIISSFADLTKQEAQKDELILKATLDFDTNLLNINALNDDMVNYINQKCSFLLIDFDDSISTIYGYDETLRFFKEFGQLTKKKFEEGVTYRFTNSQLFVFLPYNDIRTVTKTVRDYLKFITTYQSSVISFEHFRPKVSIIRYPVVTEEKLPAKLYRYLELGLDRLKLLNNQDEEAYIFFEYKFYEENQFEQQVIDFLNLAIENRQLELTFNQIIDVNSNVIWQYESELALSNLAIDPRYLLTIAKKRHRLEEIEKYHLKMVCLYLNHLETETNRLIKLTIPISKETFVKPGFNAYLIGLFKEYQIPASFIGLKIKGLDYKAFEFIDNAVELTNLGVSIDTTSIEPLFSYSFNAVHLDYKRSNDDRFIQYLKTIKVLLDSYNSALIVRGVSNKELKDELKAAGIKYIEGKLYKKVSPASLTAKIKEQS